MCRLTWGIYPIHILFGRSFSHFVLFFQLHLVRLWDWAADLPVQAAGDNVTVEFNDFSSAKGPVSYIRGGFLYTVRWLQTPVFKYQMCDSGNSSSYSKQILNLWEAMQGNWFMHLFRQSFFCGRESCKFSSYYWCITVIWVTLSLVTLVPGGGDMKTWRGGGFSGVSGVLWFWDSERWKTFHGWCRDGGGGGDRDGDGGQSGGGGDGDAVVVMLMWLWAQLFSTLVARDTFLQNLHLPVWNTFYKSLNKFIDLANTWKNEFWS